ncbi:MAG: hypothetical protein B6D65_02975 [candidate division Zixibacteria bacterium 4484_93]|nr:MAG: hypothetical protein B6D65_02975 [candidate division Zixibacteria bacterium 4484_93]
MKRICVYLLVFLLSGCAAGRLVKNRLPPPHRVEGGILFQYENKAAHSVNLAGNFNGWCGTKEYHRFDPSIGIMHDDDGDGIWEIIVPLPPGRYQYKFVIDNAASWVLDPNNPLRGVEDGIENSLIIVD